MSANTVRDQPEEPPPPRPDILSPPVGPLIIRPAESRAPDVALSLVVPTLNERESIGPLLSAVCGVLDARLPQRYEVIVIDDDSADETWRVAAALRGEFRALRVARRECERGLATAVVRGWQLGSGAVLGTINADLQHPPALLAGMLDAIADADLVVATRFATGGGADWPSHRRLASRLAHGIGRWLLPIEFARVSDPLSGYYLFRREAIAGIVLNPLGYKTLIEILARGHVQRIRECPYTMRRRAHGRSKLSLLNTQRYVVQLLRLRAAPRPRSL